MPSTVGAHRPHPPQAVSFTALAGRAQAQASHLAPTSTRRRPQLHVRVRVPRRFRVPLPVSPTPAWLADCQTDPACLPSLFPSSHPLQPAVPRKPSPPSSPSVEMRRHLLTSPHRHFLQESWQRQGEGSLAGMAGFLPILVRRSGDSKAQRPHLATPTDA